MTLKKRKKFNFVSFLRPRRTNSIEKYRNASRLKKKWAIRPLSPTGIVSAIFPSERFLCHHWTSAVDLFERGDFGC